MKKINKLTGVIVGVSVLAISVTAFAVSALSPVEITSNLTGKSVEELQAQRAEGKTYGTIASEAGVLDEFKTQMLEQKKEVVANRVEEGRIAKDVADEIIANIEENQEDCDGTGSAQLGKQYNVGFGQGSGMGNGQGLKQGARDGSGAGQGAGQGSGYGKANGGMQGQGRGMNR